MLTSLLLSLLISTQAPQPEPGPVAIRAAKVYLGNGAAVEDCIVLIEAGQIREVGRGVRVPDGAALIEHKGTLSAGLIAAASQDGLGFATTDGTRALLPEGRVADAFNPSHADFARALSAGVTSIVLVPRPENVIGGLSAVVKTYGGTVSSAQAQLSLCLGTEALVFNREPTSYSQALYLLDQLFARPTGAVAKARSGQIPVLIEVDERHEVARALEFAVRNKLKGALLGAPLAGEMVDLIKPSGLAVVFGPFELGTPKRTLDSLVALSEAGIPFAFAMRAPAQSPEGLRQSAAMCVQAGLSQEAALKALTADAARIAGVGAKVGRVERGMQADLVLWSGEPVDLTSRVEAVYVDGVRAWSAPARRTPAAQGAR